MSLLGNVGDRFHIRYRIIAGGSGIVKGTVSETDQTSQPSYVFVKPRHVFRTPHPTALKPASIIQSPHGETFLVGDNGPSEHYHGRLWNSFRVFEPTGQYTLSRRVKTIDPVTRVPMEAGKPQVIGTYWMALEAVDRQLSDREMREFIEQVRFISAVEVKPGDLIDNRQVSKVDVQLGLWIGFLN